jgi:hypothetical protein
VPLLGRAWRDRGHGPANSLPVLVQRPSARPGQHPGLDPGYQAGADPVRGDHLTGDRVGAAIGRVQRKHSDRQRGRLRVVDLAAGQRVDRFGQFVGQLYRGGHPIGGRGRRLAQIAARGAVRPPAPDRTRAGPPPGRDRSDGRSASPRSAPRSHPPTPSAAHTPRTPPPGHTHLRPRPDPAQPTRPPTPDRGSSPPGRPEPPTRRHRKTARNHRCRHAAGWEPHPLRTCVHSGRHHRHFNLAKINMWKPGETDSRASILRSV